MRVISFLRVRADLKSNPNPHLYPIPDPYRNVNPKDTFKELQERLELVEKEKDELKSENIRWKGVCTVMKDRLESKKVLRKVERGEKQEEKDEGEVEGEEDKMEEEVEEKKEKNGEKETKVKGLKDRKLPKDIKENPPARGSSLSSKDKELKDKDKSKQNNRSKLKK
jgi:hypothetical protein